MALDKMVDSTKLDNALTATADAIREKGGVAIGSGSGSIVTITDASAGPANSVTIPIEPVQDLHGYDSPWPAGGGKNLLDTSTVTVTGITFTQDADGYVTTDSASDSRAWGYSVAQYKLTLSAGSYKFVWDVKTPSSNGARGYRVYNDADDILVQGFTTVLDTSGSSSTFTLSGTTNVGVVVKQYDMVARFMVIKSTDSTAWTPYSNICPISGFSAANIYVRGINLWDGTWENGNISESTGTNDGTSTSYFRSAGYIPLKGGQSYYPYSSHRTSNYRQFYYDRDKNFLGFTGTAWGAVKNTASLAYADKICFMRFRVYGAHVDNDLTTSFNIPSTNTTTNVYGGTTYSISFGSAGIVYGGTLDVVSGTLTVDRAKTTVGAMSWSYYNTVVYSSSIAVKANTSGEESNVISDTYLTAISTTGTGSAGTWANNSIRQKSDGSVIYIKDTRYTSASAFKTAMGSVEIVYELPTPQTYTLTPTEVQLLLGTNNVWSDTGNITLKYPINSELIPFDLTNETGFADAINSISSGIEVDDIIVIGDYGLCLNNFTMSDNTCISEAGTVSGNTLIAV